MLFLFSRRPHDDESKVVFQDKVSSFVFPFPGISSHLVFPSVWHPICQLCIWSFPTSWIDTGNLKGTAMLLPDHLVWKDGLIPRLSQKLQCRISDCGPQRMAACPHSTFEITEGKQMVFLPWRTSLLCSVLGLNMGTNRHWSSWGWTKAAPCACKHNR